MGKNISDAVGRDAVSAWISGVCGVSEAGFEGTVPPRHSQGLIGQLSGLSAAVPRATVATAVRFTLQLLEARAPGQAVEVRVPPFGAVQILPGTTHRRGTPPAVIEMPAEVWLALAVGVLPWSTAISQGLVAASGNRADLGELLPLRI